MFAPAAGPRRKNDGAAVPLQQARPLRDAEGALSFLGYALHSSLRLGVGFFPKRKPRTLVRGLLGGWLMGFEPTTLGTTNRCSNQLSYSHRDSVQGHFWSRRERKDITLLPMSSPSHCDFFATFDAWRTNSKSCTWRAGFPRKCTRVWATSSSDTSTPFQACMAERFGRRCQSRAPWAVSKGCGLQTARATWHLAFL